MRKAPIHRFASWVVRGEGEIASHILLFPATVWLLLFLVMPLLLLLIMGLAQRGPYGTILWNFSLANYQRALDPVYMPVLFRSLAYAATTTILCILIGYPFAYYMSFFASSRKKWMSMLVMIPFWSSSLVVIYSWMILLGNEGLLNNLLLGMNLIDRPIGFLNRPFSVILGLTYFYLPFMILPLYGSLERIPRSYIEASKDLGAGVRQTFVKITLPLSLPGLLAGSILTFIPCLGDFLTAEFLGSPQTYMVGNLIQNQFLTAQDWPFGASLASLLVFLLFFGLYFYQRISLSSSP